MFQESDTALAHASPVTAENSAIKFDAPLVQSLNRLLDSVSECIEADGVFVRRFDRGTQGFALLACVGLRGAPDPSMPIAHACNTCARITDAGQTDPRTCRCTCGSGLNDDAPAGATSILTFPIYVESQAYGLVGIVISNTRESDVMASNLLPTIADAIAIIVTRALSEQDGLRQALIRERRLLASEIHDSLGQNLTGLRIHASLLRDAIERKDDTRIRRHLAQVEESLATTHSRVRELITDFRCHMDHQGLAHALTTTISELNQLGEVQIELTNRTPNSSLSADQEVQVFHIAREALTNIVKHANAQHGWVSLDQHNGTYMMIVEDDGIGLYSSPSKLDDDHFGMHIMRERAQCLGGRIEFGKRSNGGGSWIRLNFPYPFCKDNMQ